MNSNQLITINQNVKSTLEKTKKLIRTTNDILLNNNEISFVPFILTSSVGDYCITENLKLYISSYNNTITVWDLEKKHYIESIINEELFISNLICSDDGKWIVSSYYNKLYIYDYERNIVRTEILNDEIINLYRDEERLRLEVFINNNEFIFYIYEGMFDSEYFETRYYKFDIYNNKISKLFTSKFANPYITDNKKYLFYLEYYGKNNILRILDIENNFELLKGIELPDINGNSEISLYLSEDGLFGKIKRNYYDYCKYSGSYTYDTVYSLDFQNNTFNEAKFPEAKGINSEALDFDNYKKRKYLKHEKFISSINQKDLIKIKFSKIHNNNLIIFTDKDIRFFNIDKKEIEKLLTFEYQYISSFSSNYYYKFHQILHNRYLILETDVIFAFDIESNNVIYVSEKNNSKILYINIYKSFILIYEDGYLKLINSTNYLTIFKIEAKIFENGFFYDENKILIYTDCLQYLNLNSLILETLFIHIDNYHNVYIIEDTDLLVIKDDDNLEIWSLKEEKLISKIQNYIVLELYFSHIKLIENNKKIEIINKFDTICCKQIEERYELDLFSNKLEKIGEDICIKNSTEKLQLNEVELIISESTIKVFNKRFDNFYNIYNIDNEIIIINKDFTFECSIDAVSKFMRINNLPNNIRELNNNEMKKFHKDLKCKYTNFINVTQLVNQNIKNEEIFIQKKQERNIIDYDDINEDEIPF